MGETLLVVVVVFGLISLVAFCAHWWPGRKLFRACQRKQGVFVSPWKRHCFFVAEFLGALFASCFFLALSNLASDQADIKFLLTLAAGYVGAISGALLYSLWLFHQPKKSIMS